MKIKNLLKRLRLRTLISLAIIVILLPIVIFMLYNPRVGEASWYNDSFAYRQRFSFTHNADITSDRSVTFSLDTAELISASVMQSDCDDVRFTDINGKSLLYDLTGTCNNAATTFEIIFPSIINGTNVAYVYYGSPGAQNAEISSTGYTALTPSGGDPSITDRTNEVKGTGPIAFWNFDQGVDNTCSGGTNDVCDATNSSLDGAMTEGTWQANNMCISGKCMYFDGSNDVSTITNSSPIDFDNGLVSGVTFSAWIRTNTDGEGDVGQIFNKGTNTWCRTDTETSGLIDLECSLDLGTTDATANVSGALTKNRWHHIAMTYTDDGDDEITIYVDGTARGTSTNGDGSPATGDTNNLLIGGPTTANYNGFIDEFKIYNYERSASQIKNDAQKINSSDTAASLGKSGISYFSDTLVGYWKFDHTSGDATDYSGNNYTLTNNGTTTYVAGKFGYGSEHVPASTQYFSTASTISGVKTVSFWTNPDSTTNYYISLTSSAYITSSSGTLSATGFSNAKIYVNGVETTTITADTWQHVTVTTDTAIDANQVYVGRQGSNYYDGTLDEVHFYTSTMTSKDIYSLSQFSAPPIVHIKMDENTGTSTSFDSSGYGHNGTLTSITSADWNTGKYGSAIHFDGTSDFMDIYSSSLNTNFLGSQGTISIWAKFTSAEISDGNDGTDYIFSIAADGNNYIFLRQDSSTGLLYSFSGSSTANTGLLTPTNITDWNCYTITWDKAADTINYYLNGVFVGTDSTVGTWAGSLSSTRAVIGARLTDTTNAGNGTLDDFRFYNYVRSTKEIIEDVSGGANTLLGKPSPVSYWNLDEGGGQSANDSNSTYGNTFQLGSSSSSDSADPTWTAKGNCIINSCLDFDGSSDRLLQSAVSFSDIEDLTDMTLSAWINADTISDGGTIFYSGEGGSETAADNERYFLRWDTTSGNDLEYGHEYGTGSDEYNVFDVNLSTGTWYYVAFVRDMTANTVKLYVNGKQAGSTFNYTNDYSSGGSGEFGIGADDNGTAGTFFDGKIDEVKIYSGVLNSSEILIDYNGGVAIDFGSKVDEASTTYGGPGGNAATLLWNLDENTGTSAIDTGSGLFNNGTLTNSPVWSPGKYGSGLKFTSSTSDNDYVTRSDDADLDYTGTDSFTMEVWFKHPTTSVTETLLAKYETVGSDGGYKILMESDGDITCGIDNNNTSFPSDSATSTAATYDDDSWHQAVCVKNGSTSLTLYIDGIQIAQDAAITSSTIANNDAFFLGIDGDGSSNDYTGSLDNLVIYNYVRSQAQISYDFNRGKPLAWWKMDECQGSTLYDSGVWLKNATITPGASGNTSVGTCGSGVSTEMWNDGTTGKRNASLGFDGTDDYASVNSPSLPTGDFTYAVWFYHTADSTDYLFASQQSAGAGNEIALRQVSSGSGSNIRFDLDGSTSRCLGNNSASLNTWHHYAVTRSGSTVTGYLDGQQDCTGTDGDTLDFGSCPFYIGVDDDSATCPGSTYSNYWEGLLDDFRVYNYALTAQQIKKIMNNDAAVRFGPDTGE